MADTKVKTLISAGRTTSETGVGARLPCGCPDTEADHLPTCGASWAMKRHTPRDDCDTCPCAVCGSRCGDVRCAECNGASAHIRRYQAKIAELEAKNTELEAELNTVRATPSTRRS